MAGSYKHIVTDDGNLGSPQFVLDMLDNNGDVFETIEEMYGMIWYLTHYLVQPPNDDTVIHDRFLALYRKTMQMVVEEARLHYKEGLTIAEYINGGGV